MPSGPRSLFALTVIALLASMIVAARAATSIPSPLTSVVPPLIRVVGHYQGVADPLGEFTVVVNDGNANPMANSLVELDFSGCSDLRLAATAFYPGTTVDCATRRVRALTNSVGAARFRVVGASTNTGASPGANAPCLVVYADGVLISWPGPYATRVAILDQNGSSGVGAGDLALWIADYLAGGYFARSDYDGSATLSANDLATWIGVFLAAGSAQSGGPYCP